MNSGTATPNKPNAMDEGFEGLVEKKMKTSLLNNLRAKLEGTEAAERLASSQAPSASQPEDIKIEDGSSKIEEVADTPVVQ